jgi:hypothetical protein
MASEIHMKVDIALRNVEESHDAHFELETVATTGLVVRRIIVSK